ncbi:hypothetical protein HS088_TW09G00524 [Tripterygium wilfordii]|uniref:Uncharacterized protein n=1 Tax=Tripterygium wilfordii TaxID=458696 RepID=A0A7J7D7Y2_TRIWF|nr:hypothetical protein HS088_TW09G00524 [Tripterygium wilfordii]
METQFDEGILRITIPKLNIGPKENAKETLLQEALIEPIPQKGHEDILPKTTSDANNEEQKAEEKIEVVISERSNEAENVTEDKEDEIGEKSKESKTSVNLLENKEKEKNESDTNLETQRGGGDYEEKPGKVGPSITGHNEEKQMLINVGVATLVILTVGAQVYNTIIGFNCTS